MMLLEQPGRIGSLRLKNRVIMAPMGTNYSTTDGLSTERDKFYYAERARGGVCTRADSGQEGRESGDTPVVALSHLQELVARQSPP